MECHEAPALAWAHCCADRSGPIPALQQPSARRGGWPCLGRLHQDVVLRGGWVLPATGNPCALPAGRAEVLARNKNEEGGGGYLAWNWDSSIWGADVLLATLAGAADATYAAEVMRRDP